MYALYYYSCILCVGEIVAYIGLIGMNCIGSSTGGKLRIRSMKDVRKIRICYMRGISIKIQMTEIMLLLLRIYMRIRLN